MFAWSFRNLVINLFRQVSLGGFCMLFGRNIPNHFQQVSEGTCTCRKHCPDSAFLPSACRYGQGSFGPGSGQIWMRYVRCNGSEEELSDCPFNGWGTTYSCRHSQDAGVACQSSTSSSPPLHLLFLPLHPSTLSLCTPPPSCSLLLFPQLPSLSSPSPLSSPTLSSTLTPL